jgi:fucose 4-O-acetylase-like acetyltransferase
MATESEASIADSAPKPDARVGALDLYRGLAILLVVLGHLFPSPVRREWPWTVVVYRFVYDFHMPLFFLLSGYLFHRKTLAGAASLSGWLSMLRGKARTLLVPYLAISVLSYAGLHVARSLGGRPAALLERAGYPETSLLEAVRQILTTRDHVDNHLWFVYCLFLVFAIAPPVDALRRRVGELPLLCAAALLGLAASLHVLPDAFALTQVGLYLFYFLLGGSFARRAGGLAGIPVSTPLLLLVFFVCNAACVVLYLLLGGDRGMGPTRVAWALLLLPTGASAAILLFRLAVALERTRLASVLASLGDYSYDIYLLHQPFLVSGGLGMLLFAFRVPLAVALPLAFLAGILVPVGVSRFALRRSRVLGLLVGR